jgi:hypothetical protein
VRTRWRARAAGSAETRNPKPCEPCPSASTACGFGTQVFGSASAFNANIGAWNTASVTSLYFVCAAPGPATRTMADAHYGGRTLWPTLGRGSVRRGRLFAAAPPMRACAHKCRHFVARGLGCRYGRAEGRFDTCI